MEVQMWPLSALEYKYTTKVLNFPNYMAYNFLISKSIFHFSLVLLMDFAEMSLKVAYSCLGLQGIYYNRKTQVG